MAMTTVAEKRARQGSAMVARNAGARKRCWSPKKRPRSAKKHRGRRRAGGGSNAGRTQVDCSCDEAVCLARQAGPGPRI